MTSGIFSAAFISSQNSGGFGVAIFSDNVIHGGDASYYYRGKYRLDHNNQMSGTIDVARYTTIQNSVFGPMDSFRLKLDGHIVVNERAFELTGHIEGQPQMQIKIVLNKLEDLIEA
jgi:hypothetical protein